MMRTGAGDWIFWAILSASFAALTAVFGKIGVERLNPDFATFLRTTIILAVLGAVVVATRAFQPLTSITSRSYLFLTLSGLATGASWLCYYRALKIGPASKVAPIDKLSVVMVALIATIFLGERLSGRNWIGLLMIAGGAVLVAVRS